MRASPAWAGAVAADHGATTVSYPTPGGVQVRRTARRIDTGPAVLDRLARRLDHQPGALFHGSVTQPGRYVPWTRATDRLAMVFEARGRAFRLLALDEGAAPLVRMAITELTADPHVARVIVLPDGSGLYGAVRPVGAAFSEEDRTRQPSTLGVLRTLAAALAHPDESVLGWHGAFGYDLMISYDPIPRRHRRPPGYRDLVSFLPASVVIVDPQRDLALEVDYAFSDGGPPAAAVHDTLGDAPAGTCEPGPDPDPADYHTGVRAALRAFHAGDAFETVLSQTLSTSCRGVLASDVFARLVAGNPSPYGFLINLGRGETLVGASPEMFVRVSGDLVETCPISGTITRGRSAIEESRNVVTLLSSEKDAAELTMCTDVDRNDKSRVSRPGSVRIVSRRQIEMYSRLIHTVDHVHGSLREGLDAWDAFLSHMWAATVTGAPKRSAAEFIERWETTPRRWYGGAVGYATFDGAMDTGLTLRTARLAGGVAEVRAGATLLIGSDPVAEELETRLKASAVFDALRPASTAAPVNGIASHRARTFGPRVLLVDHEDSFVHTLAGYLRESGCRVDTRRWSTVAGIPADIELVVLSPGPGRPADFRIGDTIAAALAVGAGVFGVCLGLQGIVEYFGGSLTLLPQPVHGRASEIEVVQPGSALLRGLPRHFTAGRYHSLCAVVGDVAPELNVTAVADGDVVMAVEHHALPVHAVQFHPESLLSLDGDIGHQLINNVVDLTTSHRHVLPEWRKAATT